MIVYHYTSIDTLGKILTGCSAENPFMGFRATHCLFLNDSTENVMGIPIAQLFLPAIEEELKIKDGERLTNLLRMPIALPTLLSRFRMFDERSFSLHRFVVSFSEDRDNLVMWSMYGNKGDGVAIGIDTGKLSKMLTYDKQFFNPETGRCSYWSRERLVGATPKNYPQVYKAIKERYEALTNPKVLDAMKKMYVNEMGETDNMLIQQDLLENLVKYCGIFNKQDCWNNEHEYRLSFEVFGRSKKIKYRKNPKGDYIPYTDIQIPAEGLKEIIIGPLCGQNAYWHVNSLLDLCDIKGVQVDVSRMPLV